MFTFREIFYNEKLCRAFATRESGAGVSEKRGRGPQTLPGRGELVRREADFMK